MALLDGFLLLGLGQGLLVLLPSGLIGNVVCSLLMLPLREKSLRLRTIAIAAPVVAAPTSAFILMIARHDSPHQEYSVGVMAIILLFAGVFFWVSYFIFIPQWVFLIMTRKIRMSVKAAYAWRFVLSAVFLVLLAIAHAFIGHILGLPSD